MAQTAVYRAPLKTIGEQELKMAMDILLQYEIVFTFDDMRDRPAAVDALLRKHMGWQHPFRNISVPHNVHAANKQLTDEQEQYFTELNKWDLQLYTYAKELFLNNWLPT